MPNNEVPSQVPHIFSSLFAVVLYSEHGSATRVRFDLSTRTWLKSSDYGVGFVQQEAPRRGEVAEMRYMNWTHAPSPDDMAAAAAVAEAHRSAGECTSCHQADLGFHVITPDVYGEPRVACVLRPDTRAVGSYGGGGKVKHLGGAFGCQFVRAERMLAPGDSYLAVGHFLFGEPLTTIEAIDRPWCTKCVGTAHNVRNNLRAALTQELGRPATVEETRVALSEYEARRTKGDQIRWLLDEIGDRSRDQLLLQMRAGMEGLTPERYAAEEKARGW